MITSVVQRWRDRRGSYRPAGETIRSSEYDVSEIPDDNTARRFVERHHYSGSYPAARLRTGLYHRGEHVGTIVFGQPMNNLVLSRIPGDPDDNTELSRVSMLDKGTGKVCSLPRRTQRLLPDGRVLSARAIQKIRARERGWRYSTEILERFGAAPLGERDDARAWLETWLPSLTRMVRHPGMHVYLFGLDRITKRHLPASLPYPKLDYLAEASALA